MVNAEINPTNELKVTNISKFVFHQSFQKATTH